MPLRCCCDNNAIGGAEALLCSTTRSPPEHLISHITARWEQPQHFTNAQANMQHKVVSDPPGRGHLPEFLSGAPRTEALAVVQAWAVALNPLWPACGPPRQRRTSDAIAVGWWPCPWRQQPHFGAPPKSCLQGCVKNLSHIRCCKSVLATAPPPMHAPCRVRELLCVYLRQGERLDLTMRALPDTGLKQRADCKTPASK